MNATILEAYDYGINVRLEDGSTQVVILARFSEGDQRFISEWKEMSRFFQLDFVPDLPIPAVTDADINAIGIPSWGMRHETRHFSLSSDRAIHADTIREMARIFEATYHAVAANPFGLAISVPKDRKIPVRLFSTMGKYYTAGGPLHSGGAYSTVRKEILIPLPQAGFATEERPRSPESLLRGQNGSHFSSALDPWVLIHETTHALVHDWLGAAPMWFNEGFAEYTASLTYENGQMTERGRLAKIRDRFTKIFPAGSQTIRFVHPVTLANMSNGSFYLTKVGYNAPPVLPTFHAFEFGTGSLEFFTMPNSFQATRPTPTPQFSARDRAYHLSKNYASALAAVHHLVETEQSENVRRYLFELLYFEWEQRNYLRRFESAAKAYADQIDQEMLKYRQALARHETDPSSQAPPEIPDSIEAPRILTSPRSPKELSRKSARERAAANHLRLPAEYSLATFQ